MTLPTSDKPELITLRQQVAALPPYVLAAWRSRYGVTDGMDLEARAMLGQEAAAVRTGVTFGTLKVH